MNRNSKTTLFTFEVLEENSLNRFVGGFSASFNGDDNDQDDGSSNNCAGGNCVEGCGKGQNPGCNTVTGFAG